MSRTLSNVSYSVTPYDVIGVVASVVSILAIFYSLIQANLPCVKLRELDEMLNAVDEQLNAAAEDDLLVEADFIRQTSEALTILRDDADELRPSVHLAIRLFQQFIGLVTGLSWQISAHCTNAMAIKAELTTKITEAWQKMKRLHCQSE